jgi:hypothetical protein
LVPRILLTDTNRWPCAARLAIGLSNLGCDVSAICPVPGHPLLKTRAVKKLYRYLPMRPVESLAAAIEASQPDIILPCDDRGVQHLHELYERAKTLNSAGARVVALIERSLGAPSSFPIVSARYDLLETAREEGLLVPDTKLIDSFEDLRNWQSEQPFPWVLKADGTWGGRGVRVAENLQQAEHYFVELTKLPSSLHVFKRLVMSRDRFWVRPWWIGKKPHVIAQSHISGRPANCAVACWEGKMLAGIAVEVISAQGLRGPATVVRVVHNSEMLIFAERLARRLRLSGIFGLDFMIDNASETTYLIEMNPRSTPLSHLQLGKGADMVSAIWAQLSSQPLPDLPPITTNDLIAYFPQAWNSKSEFLPTSFQDIPQGEPELVQELLDPWSERSVPGWLLDHFRRLTADVTPSKDFVFPSAVETLKFSEGVRGSKLV